MIPRDAIGSKNWLPKAVRVPKLITLFSDAFSYAPIKSPDAYDWITWLLKQLPIDGNDFDNFIRPDDIERVFGRGYTSAKTDEDRRTLARDAILAILPDWFSAAPLSVLEAKIVTFINANEGKVKRPTSVDSKAKRGRQFALRLVSHLSYLAGVLSQIASKTAAASKSEPLAITQSLPQLVRRGVNSPYHLYLDRQKVGRSRQALEKEFQEVTRKIDRLPSDNWDQIRSKVTDANIGSFFGTEWVTKFIESGKQIASPPPGLPKPTNDDE